MAYVGCNHVDELSPDILRLARQPAEAMRRVFEPA
jgi:hypothetical protein